MGKRNLGKLELNRETVRDLSMEALEGVEGGKITTPTKVTLGRPPGVTPYMCALCVTE